MVKFPFYARLALTLFAIALILLFMWAGRSLLVPLILFFPGCHPAPSGGSFF